MTVDNIKIFAEKNFPKAPEMLAESLGIEIRYSPLDCDGWCLQFDNRAVIRINSEMSDVRKRFTLAHELGHLIYKIPTVVGESVVAFERKNEEERLIDKFAAELLLPTSIILNSIQEIPVTAKTLQKIAKKAKVSDLAVALRVANLAYEIGLSNASVVFYENDTLKWQWSETLRLTGNTPATILAECTTLAPNPARIPFQQNEVIVASFIENPNFNTKILFLQLVNESDGFKQLREERIRELEKYLFADDIKFRQSLAGRFGAFKLTAQNMFLDEAIQEFNTRLAKNSDLINLHRLKSEKGREYIKLKLESWTKK
ncbi:MAG TPA: ImmA/IrrE family metallo-endopeptidase [Pyrinomonadaceae bacterium]|nr:ImmA/IrrE family metallo-endopeptidase [Pyrinomonadaceae bacterium]